MRLLAKSRSGPAQVRQMLRCVLLTGPQTGGCPCCFPFNQPSEKSTPMVERGRPLPRDVDENPVQAFTLRGPWQFELGRAKALVAVHQAVVEEAEQPRPAARVLASAQGELEMCCSCFLLLFVFFFWVCVETGGTPTVRSPLKVARWETHRRVTNYQRPASMASVPTATNDASTYKPTSDSSTMSSTRYCDW